MLALVWGSSFFFVDIGLRDLMPTQVVFARLTIGAIVLGVVCLVSRQRLPRGVSTWAHLFVVAMLLCVVPFLLFAWAQQNIPSSIASILNATTPLMTMIVALLALPSERPDRWKVGGLGVGFIGILFVLDPFSAFDGDAGPRGYLACLGATLSYGIAFVYLRRFVSPRGIADCSRHRNCTRRLGPSRGSCVVPADRRHRRDRWHPDQSATPTPASPPQGGWPVSRACRPEQRAPAGRVGQPL
ncbi:DMT family transporter [Agreia bicolorata]|nr:DMT family transporter [Agreia bicolorata]